MGQVLGRVAWVPVGRVLGLDQALGRVLGLDQALGLVRGSGLALGRVAWVSAGGLELMTQAVWY
ncbi:hypothetical protein GCM10008960_20140 [Deinococcus sedimenti]|uniref:Uncharacterized protein n=1 Tax=Deinococcus sedimenti TaxID=1867090 RepID=A0ABQ2S3K8_9DEIO|nr:hypothetical protein GCM10008960_20140 [Deinococcus sedimenti]